MKTLFVGGPSDGQRKEWDPKITGHTLKVAQYNIFPMFDPVSMDQATVGMNIHTYTLKRFREGNTDYVVAFHSSIKNPMEALIKGYHYHRKPRYGRLRSRR